MKLNFDTADHPRSIFKQNARLLKHNGLYA
jgi:hypothetical protein